MNLYKVSQDVNNDWDTFDAMVVRAESAEVAAQIKPSHHTERTPELMEEKDWKDCFNDWAGKVEDVKVELIAENVTGQRAIILASFNAG